jgi:hypothetical protein
MSRPTSTFWERARQDHVASVQATEQRPVGVDANECFARRNITELTIELEVITRAGGARRALGHERDR